MKIKFRSLTLDLDGTLLDTVADLARACNLMLEDLGEPLRTEDEIHRFVGKGMTVLVERCLTRGESLDPHRVALGIAAFRKHYALVNGRHALTYPGVMEGLEAFRALGLPMACVTNKPADFAEPLLERMGLADYFVLVVGGDTTAHKKPHPEPLLHACAVMGVAPGENLHIGDSKHDIHAARAAGCPVWCVPYGYNEGEAVDRADCDALVSTLLDAATLLAAV